MYRDSFCLLPDTGANQVVKLLTRDGPFFVHTDIHAVKISTGDLRVYSFDSFINHSCEPNSVACDEVDGAFTTIATRHIRRGEEVTTDYDSFIYSYTGIPHCQCGSEYCRGSSFGFGHLPRRAQEALLHRTHPEVVAAWLADNPLVYCFLGVSLPPGLGVQLMASPTSIEACKIKRQEHAVASFELIVTGPVAVGTVLFSCVPVALSARTSALRSAGSDGPPVDNAAAVHCVLHNPWLQQHDAGKFELLLEVEVPALSLASGCLPSPGTCSVLDVLENTMLRTTERHGEQDAEGGNCIRREQEPLSRLEEEDEGAAATTAASEAISGGVQLLVASSFIPAGRSLRYRAPD